MSLHMPENPNLHTLYTRIIQSVQSATGRDLDVQGYTLPAESLDQDKRPVDATFKIIVRDLESDEGCFILCSNPRAPDLVTRNAARAVHSRQSLPGPLGSVVQIPWAEGRCDLMSWAVFSLKRPLPSHTWSWRVQRTLLTPYVLRWLREVTRVSCRELHDSEELFKIERSLQDLAQDEDLEYSLRQAARTSLHRLQTGVWKPRSILAHNDLWKGNILLPKDMGSFFKGPPFFVIDWAGSELRGMPFFDLAKFCTSFQVPMWVRHRAVRTHCSLLHAELQDGQSYLVAALARIGAHLDAFPKSAFVSMAQDIFFNFFPFQH